MAYANKYKHIYIHNINIYIYIYIYVCLSVCVRVYVKGQKQTGIKGTDSYPEDFLEE